MYLPMLLNIDTLVGQTKLIVELVILTTIDNFSWSVIDKIIAFDKLICLGNTVVTCNFFIITEIDKISVAHVYMYRYINNYNNLGMLGR